jgi:bile acid:Na+ symporter, BASS family
MLVQIALPTILITIMFSLGLGLGWSDFARVAKEPRAFTIGAFNQVIVVPVVALIVALSFGLSPALAVGLMILGVCPGGVLSNVTTKFARGNLPLSISLTGVTSLLAIITVPIVVAASVSYFMGAEAPPVDVAALGMQVFLMAAVPVILGMLVTHFLPDLVARFGGWLSRIAFGMFIFLVIAAVATNWGVFSANFQTLGLALGAMNLALLLIGLATAKAAKLSVADATTVAIESGIQNGTLGIAVGMLVAGADNTQAFPLYVLPTAIYSISVWILSLPFAFWRRSLVSAT